MELRAAHAFLMCLLHLMLLVGFSFAENGSFSNYIDLTGFSSTPDSFFNTWKLQVAADSKQTHYTLVTDDSSGNVLHAEADASVAGLFREVAIDPAEFPLLVWSWKISGVVEQAVLSDKRHDDAPVRLLISFGKNILKGGKPTGSLCYVWSAREPEGTYILNPYISNVMAIVVASGTENVGIWQHYRRNIVRDYYRAFGEAPGEVRAITLISDTDNTEAKISAWYGAIGLAAEAGDSSAGMN